VGQAAAVTIAIMTDKVKLFTSNLFMRLLVLIFTLICLFGCKNDNRSIVDHNDKTESNVSLDSLYTLEVHVKLLPKVAILLNYVNDFYETESPLFENNTDSILTIVKEIKLRKPTVFSYLGLVYEGGELISHEHSFLIEQSTGKLYVEYQKNGDIKLNNIQNSIVIIDEMVEDYKVLVFKSKTSLNNLDEINELFEKWNAKYKKLEQYSILTEINKYEYLKSISLLNISQDLSLFKKVTFNTNLNLHQARSFYLNYIEATKDSYDSTLKDNPLYNKIVFNYLKENKYDENRTLKKGFMHSSFYKQNKTLIDSNLKVSSDISNRILNFEMLTIENEPILLKDFINESKKEFYLLDFWATWCSPCVQEITIIKRKNIPLDKIGVISLSVDKIKSFSKWLKKSNQLALENSFQLLESDKNFKLIKDLEINEIPRFILINKTGEIIQINFKKPSDKDFEQLLIRLTRNE
jgi:thiol-disulfide isomerase/thioredoxin